MSLASHGLLVQGIIAISVQPDTNWTSKAGVPHPDQSLFGWVLILTPCAKKKSGHTRLSEDKVSGYARLQNSPL